MIERSNIILTILCYHFTQVAKLLPFSLFSQLSSFFLFSSLLSCLSWNGFFQVNTLLRAHPFTLPQTKHYFSGQKIFFFRFEISDTDFTRRCQWLDFISIFHSQFHLVFHWRRNAHAIVSIIFFSKPMASNNEIK